MIVDFIQKMFNHSFEKEWYETYWAFDLHGTIIKPTYKGTEVIYLVVKVSRLGERYDDCKKIIIKNYKGSENSLINFRIRELKTQIKELQKTKTKKHGSI